MTDNNTNEVPEITPLPVPPVGMPKVPITLFNVWTWSTPVIPSFYWNVYSAEQRIKEICKEIGRIEAYLDYAASTANEAHLEIDDHINKVYAELSKRIDDLTVRLTTEVARLDALISAETAARKAGDEKLEAELTQETTERKTADAKLTSDLEKEVQDRQDADEGLHGEISTETTARIHADDALHAEISAEKTAREEADTAATASITQEVADRKAGDDSLSKRIDANGAEISKIDASLATKLERNDLKASGKITLTPGEGNTVFIGDSFEADFKKLEDAITGLTSSLASETDERRADDSKLWNAVNARIERGKILAGEGISVVNDPDQSTVTISSNVKEDDLTAIEAKATEAKNTADSAATTAGEAKSKAEAASTKATSAESKAEEALTAAQGSLKTVAHTASLAGDGTSSTPLALTPATATTLGGVKVGSGLAVTSDGILSATAGGDSNHTGAGLYSVSIGEGAETNSTSKGGTAVGFNATTLDSWTTVVGYKAKCDGYQSVALGSDAAAYSSFSTVVGDDANSQGEYGTALGQSASAYGKNSVAIGAGSIAREEDSVSFGAGSGGSSASGKPVSRRLTNVTDPVNDHDAATKAYVDAHAGGEIITGAGLLGNGTPSNPLRINPGGYGLEISGETLISTVPSIGVAVVRCNIDSFSLAKGESKTVSKDFAGIQGRVSVHGLSGEGHLIAVIPDTSANANLAGAVASVRVNGSSSGDGTYTITKVTATIYAAANELQNINSFGITLLFSDTSSYASYQEIPKAS